MYYNAGHPDMTFVVDWALKTNYLYIYLLVIVLQCSGVILAQGDNGVWVCAALLMRHPDPT